MSPVWNTGMPNLWTFHVVANIHGRHYPLAVAGYIPTDKIGYNCINGSQLERLILGAVKCFSFEENKIAISLELQAATKLYYTPENVFGIPFRLPVFSARRDTHWGQDNGITFADVINNQINHGTVFNSRMTRFRQNFPFISRCLLASLTLADCTTRPVPLPLPTIYVNTNISYGMVIIDISDLDRVSHGILGFCGVAAALRPELHGQPPVVVYHEHLSRRPLSLVEYFQKSSMRLSQSSDAYNTLHVIDEAATESKYQAYKNLRDKHKADTKAVVWPSSGASQIFENGHIQRRDASHDFPPLIDLVRAAKDINMPDLSILQNGLNITTIRRKLKEVLEEFLEPNSKPLAVGRLIGFVFGGSQHLDLTRFKNVSLEDIRSALQRRELQHVKIISVNLENMSGYMDGFIQLLIGRPTIEKVYLMSDHITRCNCSTLTSQHLIFLRKFVQTCGQRQTAIFSLPLYCIGNRPRLPLPVMPPVLAKYFPVSSIFLSDHIKGVLEEGYECQWNVSHLMLTPEQLITRLLHSLSLGPSIREAFLAFANSFKVDEWKSDRNVPDNLLAPAPILVERATPRNPEAYAELDLTNFWTLLVREEVVPCSEAAYTWLRYAFVRQDPNWNIARLQAVGVAEFMAITAPGSRSTIWKEWERARTCLICVGGVVPRNPESSWLKLMDTDEANEFLARFV